MLYARRYPTLLSLFIVTSLLLSGCGLQPGPVGNPSTPTEAVPTATIAPSPTPDPSRALLVIPGSDPASLPAGAQPVHKALESLAASSGMAVEVRTELSEADLTPGVKVVVVLSTPGQAGNVDVAGLSAKAPATQFVAIGIPGAQVGANVSVIGGDNQVVQTAFLAGYIAALTSSDWRAGTLSLGDAPGQAAREAFLEGARYLCGICLPKIPPYPGYPVFVDATSATDWQSAIEALKAKGVETVYVSPALASQGVWDALSQAGMRLVAAADSADAVQPRWTATIESDSVPALKTLWPDLMAGKSGQALNTGLSLSHVDGSVLTVGKMRLVEQVVEDLAAGRIGVGN